jgi:hypothetical protein
MKISIFGIYKLEVRNVSMNFMLDVQYDYAGYFV